MQADSIFDPPLDRPLSVFHPTLFFRTPDELRTFFIKERDWLSAIRKKALSDGADAVAGNAVAQLVNGLTNRANKVGDSIEQNADQSAFEAILNAYLSNLKTHAVINSESRVGVAVSKISEEDANQAMRVTVIACNLALEQIEARTIARWMKAGGTLALIQQGLQESPPQLDSFLQGYGDTWGKRFGAVEQDQKQVVDAQSAALGAFNQQLKEANSSAEKFNADARSALDRGEARLKAVEDTYHTAMSVQAPTTYWRTKKRWHYGAAALWALLFILVAGIGASLTYYRVWLSTVAPELALYQSHRDLPAPSYGVFIPIIAAGFLIVWVLRIISRQILANLSGAEDASERVSMVMTFLALMQKPDHVKADDRILILSALFRPGSRSGDDAAPPNWFDLLMQRVKPEKR